MNRLPLPIFVALIGATIATAATPPDAPLKGGALLAQARVRPAAARQSALAARPGRITDAELERETGGSGLRYSFDILAKGRTFEVGVDAKTGAILENKVEGRHAD